MSETVLALEELSLRFGGLVALDRVSLAVRRGEMFAIVGPNGAGKTSLINCVSGIYRPSAGRVRFEGRDITRLPPHKVPGLGIARTFQHLELYPQMTVLENLMLGRHVYRRHGLLAAGLYWGPYLRWELEQRARVEEMIEFFELEGYRKRRVGDLPYGIQKVIGLARAFAAEPRLVLLDEPSAGLNRQEKEDLARFLLRARRELAPTVVWIEHDMQLVRDLADRMIVLHYGSELATGAPDAVLSDPRVVQAYLGAQAGASRASASH